MISFVAGISSAFMGAFANIMAMRVMKFSRPRDYLAVNFGLIFLMLLPFAPWFFYFQPKGSSILVLLLAIGLDLIGNYCYFRAFEVNDAIQASTLLALSPVIALLFFPMIRLGEANFKFLQIIGVILIVVGIIFLTIMKPKNSAERLEQNQKGLPALIYPFLAAVAFGVNIYPVKYLLAQEIVNPYTYYMVRAPFIALFCWLIFRPRFNWITAKRTFYISLRLLFVIGQWLLLLSALKWGNPVIVKTISDASPLFVVFISVIFLKEKISRLSLAATSLIVLGMIFCVM